MNYLAMHTQSNLILQAVTSPSQPTNNFLIRYIKVSDTTLSKYYKLLSKKNCNGLLDIAELAAASPYFLDSLSQKA